MSPAPVLVWLWLLGFPRVSGDEPGSDSGQDVGEVFSPRERG